MRAIIRMHKFLNIKGNELQEIHSSFKTAQLKANNRHIALSCTF